LLGADVVVIGGCIAGSAAALAAARKGAEVVLLIKLPNPEEANTRYAQGGIVYTILDDSPGLLVEDILGAGSGSRAAAELLHYRLDVEEEVALADLPR
jgi:L-aspartate oxidase